MRAGSRPLRASLWLLLPLAMAGAVQAALLPRRPWVAELPVNQVQQRLQSLALASTPLRSEPPWQSAELALSSLHRLQLDQGLELQLQRLAVRRRPDFQLAMAVRAWTPGRRDLARAKGQYQVCLVPAGAGVMARQLSALAEQGSTQLPMAASRLLGLQPNRSWRCLMVSLSQRDSSPQASAAAAALWPRLLRALTPLAS